MGEIMAINANAKTKINKQSFSELKVGILASEPFPLDETELYDCGEM